MDLFIYLIIAVGVGLFKVSSSNKMSTLQDISVMSEPGAVAPVTTGDYNAPIGNNLQMYKDPNAFMLILEEFGLK